MKAEVKRKITIVRAEKLLCGLPLIIGADFNTARDTMAFKQFDKAMDLESSSGLMKSAYPEDGNKYSAMKWRRGGNQKSKIKEVDQTIDFIFHSKHFKCRSYLDVPSKYTVLRKTNHARLPFWNYPSDHFAIGSVLELTARADKKTDRLPIVRGRRCNNVKHLLAPAK